MKSSLSPPGGYSKCHTVSLSASLPADAEAWHDTVTVTCRVISSSADVNTADASSVTDTETLRRRVWYANILLREI